mgnify:CR=1 FL=1
MDPRKVRKIWQIIYDAFGFNIPDIQDLFTSKQSNQSIKTVTNYFLMKPMLFSNLELHLTTTRSSTFSGFNLALLGVTTLPATEKTRSDLDEAAGIGKTTLTILFQFELNH